MLYIQVRYLLTCVQMSSLQLQQTTMYPTTQCATVLRYTIMTAVPYESMCCHIAIREEGK